MSAFTKHVHVGTLHRKTLMPVFVTIRYSEDGRLSITGVVSPEANGNADECGQITDTLVDRVFRNAEGIDAIQLHEVWKRWHLNDMVAGTPRQMAYLRDNPIQVKYPHSYYEEACKVLESDGLNPDPETGYRYGSAWLREEVPDHVLTWLKSLPDTDKLPVRWMH